MSDDQEEKIELLIRVVKNYISVLTILAFVMIGVFSFVAIDHFKMKRQLFNLQIDFGRSEGALSEKFPDNAVHYDNWEKHIKYRGSSAK